MAYSKLILGGLTARLSLYQENRWKCSGSDISLGKLHSPCSAFAEIFQAAALWRGAGPKPHRSSNSACSTKQASSNHRDLLQCFRSPREIILGSTNATPSRLSDLFQNPSLAAELGNGLSATASTVRECWRSLLQRDSIESLIRSPPQRHIMHPSIQADFAVIAIHTFNPSGC